VILGQLARFLQVGAIGFAIDATVLWALVYPFAMPPISSRVISFLATISVTFVLNARYTFSVPIRESSKTRYAVIQIVGAGINFLAYSVLVLGGWLGPLWSLVVGSALSSLHNFLMIRAFVFGDANDRSRA